MQLVYYRNQEGKITSHHNVPKDWTPEYLKEQIEKYNSTNSPSHKAFLVEVKDGSFEQYLLDSLHRKYRLAADAIQAAKDALGEALDCIESLEVKERRRARSARPRDAHPENDRRSDLLVHRRLRAEGRIRRSGAQKDRRRDQAFC